MRLDLVRLSEKWWSRNRCPKERLPLLLTSSHHPARLTLGVCVRRAPVLSSLHARDLVMVVRERIQKNQLRVYDVSRACFRRRLVVIPSKNVTNSCQAVSARPGIFLPGPGARQSGWALFCCRVI